MYRLRCVLIAFCCLLTLPALANTVDDFTASQGPITVGPNEVPPENIATGFFPGIIGGFRVLAPVVGEESPASATATTSIGGGEFECDVNLTRLSEEDVGGCVIAWAPDQEGQSFDLTNAGAFEIEVLEADMGAFIFMLLTDGSVDPNTIVAGGETNGVIAFIESPGPGTFTLPIDQFIDPINPFFDFNTSSVSNIVLITAFEPGFDGVIRLGSVSSTGPIGGGDPIDPPPPDDVEDVTVEEVSGTYFNAGRDGEGCQITLEGDGQTVVMTCYIYAGGEQAWIIGAGTFADNSITFSEMTITGGADYGDSFSPGDVQRTPWGSVTMDWLNCNDALLTFAPTLPGFFGTTIEVTKVTQANCAGSGPDASVLLNQGTLFDPLRDGEGFQLAVQGESGIYVLTWYTYLDGAQVWLIGTGIQDGNRIVFDDLVITRGGEFGPLFNPDDIERTPWGSLVLEYADCNNATATITPLAGQTAFSAFTIVVR